jgi:hypothetical protein
VYDIQRLSNKRGEKVEFASSESHAAPAPIARPSVAPAKPKRIRDRRRRPAKIDKRSGAWKRIVELMSIYESGLGDRQMTPLLASMVHEAAMATTTAEIARARFLKGEPIRIDAVVSAERVAKAAVDKLHLVDTAKREESSLAEHFARPVRPA